MSSQVTIDRFLCLADIDDLAGQSLRLLLQLPLPPTVAATAAAPAAPPAAAALASTAAASAAAHPAGPTAVDITVLGLFHQMQYQSESVNSTSITASIVCRWRS